MICGSTSCGCAFTSTTLVISNVDGVIGLEQAEFTDITELQNDVADIFAALALLPDTYVDETGDDMTGPLGVTSTGPGLSLRESTESPYVEWRSLDGVTRYGYLQAHNTSTRFIFNIENSFDFRLLIGGADRIYIPESNGSLLVGKMANNIATSGIELYPLGGIWTSRATLATNIQSNKTGAADVNGGVHLSVQSAGTQIGSITRATASTTAYNTSSDEDLKENIVEIDDELAEWIARIVEPVMFNWKVEPDVQMAGYIAQRVAAVWPGALDVGLVTPGYGNIEDRTWDADGNETTPEGVWAPWQMDNSKLVPILHAALQSQMRKLDSLTARVEALEAR